MAERQGFEPWEGLHPQRFSRPPRSTTPAPLRGGLERSFSRSAVPEQEGMGINLRSLGDFDCPCARMT